MSEALSQFPLPWLMGLALLLFLFAFGGVTFQTFRASAKARHDEIARLPLEGEDHG